MNLLSLQNLLQERYGHWIQKITQSHGELTAEVPVKHSLSLCEALKTDSEIALEQLIDVTAVDYLHYGASEWETDSATATGFERAVTPIKSVWTGHRFAVVYHLLSLKHNHRLRLKIWVSEGNPQVPSVTPIWASANWFEREVYDLFGINFIDHPDLRRILTDYGFVGHPFRKDFPLIGEVEMRYDAKEGRVIYEPVSIEPRTLVPKVIREDQRYWEEPTHD